MSDWFSRAANERMQVDSEFSSRVRDSDLTSQQWGLLMTAIEFEIENPEDPENARIVADTSKLSGVIEQARAAGERGQGGSGGSSGPGLGDKIKGALGLGGGSDPLRETAETLANDYASRLQKLLEERGKWDETCKRAAE